MIIVSLAVLLLLAALLCVKVKISIRYNGNLSFKVYIAGFEASPKLFKRKKQSSGGEKPSENNEEQFAENTGK